MEEEEDITEGTQNVRNEGSFNDQMPLYPDNYDVKRTVSAFKLLLLICFSAANCRALSSLHDQIS